MASAASGYKAQVWERRRQQLLQVVAGVRVLPTSSVVPMRVLQLQRQAGTKLSDFAEALAADAGLVAKVLAVANAQVAKTTPQPAAAGNSPAAPAAPKTITQLSQAVNLIGLDNLLPLVFGLSLGGIFNKLALPPAERLTHWRCSLLKGLIAREYACTHAPDVEEEAYLCAVAQDVAMPLLHAADRATWPEIQMILGIEDDADRQERERNINGMDHAELGGKLLAHVGAPAVMATATEAHHNGFQSLKRAVGEQLAAPLHLASLVPHKAVSLNNALAQRMAQTVSAACGIDPAGAVELLKRAGERFAKALTTFGDGEEQSAAFKEFMQSMCGQVAVSVESAVRVSANTITDLRTREATLQGAVTDLQQKVLQSDFDPMTKVLNRRGFTERAKRLLDGANRRRAWCAVGFIDLDNFKRLNDNYSHATGDDALVLVASRLSEAVNRKGIAGRIGGDEFCFMVVSQVGEFDQQEADRIKAALSGLQVEANGETVKFTTSVGLLSLGEPPCPLEFEAAMERADELMYEGKKNGKDRCVVGRIHTAGGGAANAPLLAAGSSS